MRKVVGVIAGSGLLAAASFVVIHGASSPQAAASGLTPFDSCDTALGYLKDEALERMGPYGLEYRGGDVGFDTGAQARESVATEESAAAGAPIDGGDAGGAGEYSATNVQEVGVDEPDVVKTDGQIMVTAVDNRVRIYDVTGADSPRELSTIDLRPDVHGADLLLADDTLIVFSTTWTDRWRHDRMPLVGGDGTVTVIDQVDLSDPTRPAVTGTLEIDARMLDARRSDERVTLVTVSQPRVEVPVDPDTPTGSRGPSRSDERQQESWNKQAIAESTAADWLPGYRLESAGSSSEGTLVSCDHLHRPGEFPGFGTVSVVSFDIDATLTVEDATAVLSGGDLVYATADSLYVTTTGFGNGPIGFGGSAPDIAIGPGWPGRGDTDVHTFGLSDDGPATYLASGRVQGWIKDRFALSEHEGVLRVATTTSDDDGVTSSQVVTLQRRGDELVELGSVGDLGKTEQIFAVRYLGDVAYVVTFRQTDPLYVIDLSDPKAPKATGELKITGYSGYLHNVADGRLIGVGQEATEDGRTIGAQVSLFDVSDPADPRKLAGHVVERASTDAEMDPHAFLFWDASRQLVIPIMGDRPDKTGALVLTVGDDTLDEQGFVRYAGPSIGENPGGWWSPYAMRNVVVGDHLYTVWENGLQVSSLSTLEPEGFAAFDPAN